MGTPAFMAPEQARGLWDQVDARSDLWAVGATMFSLLTGSEVHTGRTGNEVLIAAATKPAPPLASVTAQGEPWSRTSSTRRSRVRAREPMARRGTTAGGRAERLPRQTRRSLDATAPRLTVPPTVGNRTSRLDIGGACLAAGSYDGPSGRGLQPRRFATVGVDRFPSLAACAHRPLHRRGLAGGTHWRRGGADLSREQDHGSGDLGRDGALSERHPARRPSCVDRPLRRLARCVAIRRPLGRRAKRCASDRRDGPAGGARGGSDPQALAEAPRGPSPAPAHHRDTCRHHEHHARHGVTCDPEHQGQAQLHSAVQLGPQREESLEARMPLALKSLPFALIVTLVVGQVAAAPPEPTKVECIAASEAAQDLRNAGKLREARIKFTLCVSDSCPGPVSEDCAGRLKDLAAATPSVVFEAKDGAGNDLAAVRVTVDGKPLVERLDGTAIDVDPGEHRFAFEDSRTGLRLERILVIHEGDKGRHVAFVLGEAPRDESRATRTKRLSGAPAPEAAPTDAGRDQRTWGLVLGSAGVAGLLVGSVFGLVAKGTYDGVGQACQAGSGTCSNQDASDSQTAHSQATIRTVGFVAGAALLAGGAVIYLTAPKGGGVAVSPALGANGAGVQLEATW